MLSAKQEARGDDAREIEARHRHVAGVHPDWLEMDLNIFNASARQALHQHIDACVSDLKELLNRLDKLKDDRP